MGVVEHDPSRWDLAGTWTVESRDAALARTPEFGRRFFQAVFDEFPEMGGARFLQWSVQPGDVYAVFDLSEGGVGAQVDPDLEFIIVWGTDGQAEYGDWCTGQVRQHLAEIHHIDRYGSSVTSVEACDPYSALC